MPFDALPENIVSDAIKLRLARDGIAKGWVRGEFGLEDEQRHCLLGWVLEACDWDEKEATTLAVKYVYPSLPVAPPADTKIEAIMRFNDRTGRKHHEVVAVLDHAISLAMSA